jgi:hypothetical protein
MDGSVVAHRSGRRRGPAVHDGGNAAGLCGSLHVDNQIQRHDQQPIDVRLCGNGGAGELIDISGTMSSLFHLTIDDSGGTHLVLKEDNLRLQGIGEITGNKYQFIRVGTETFEVNSGGLPITDTFESNFKVISQGSDSDDLAHILRRITINENGTVTTEIEKISVVCT